MSQDWKQIRQEFLALQQLVRGKPLVYLDNAATALKPRGVGERVSRFYMYESANVHRGVHYLSELATENFEKARQTVQQFINAPSPEQIVFTSGTTSAINLIAYSLGQNFSQGDEIIISEMEHHSNIVPWQLLRDRLGVVLRVIPFSDEGVLDLEGFSQLINEKTRLVSVVYVSNSLGTVNPVSDIIQKAHNHGVPVLIDGAQAVPHMKVDVQKLDCDYFVFSGHKLYGPTGIGVLYGKKSALESLPPFMGGGEMIRYVSFEKTEFAPPPARFEAGTPHIAGAIGLSEAINFVNEIGMDRIYKREQELLSYATEALNQIDGVRIIGTAPHKAAIIQFLIDDIHPHDIGSILDDQGIAIRAGHHCCQPVMQHYSVPATARASLAFYNDTQDIDRLVAGIKYCQEIFA